MADDGVRSSSEELLRRAREGVGYDPTGDDAYVPRSPADEYIADVVGEAPTPTGGRTEDVSAAEIAEELARMRPSAPARTEAPATDEPTIPTPPSNAESARQLPDWAQGDPEHGTAGTASAAPAGPVSERIRGLTAEPDRAQDAVPTEFPGDRWSTSTPEWEARPKKEASTGPSLSWIRPLISLAVFGVFAVGFLVAQFDGNEPVDSLTVGDCFTVGDVEEVDQVPVVDCTETHDSELFARVTIAGFGSEFPGDDPLFDWLFTECVDRFPSYVGEPYETSPYWVDMFIPTEDGWSDGDRVGLCTVVRVDSDLNIVPGTGSLRGSGANA